MNKKAESNSQIGMIFIIAMIAIVGTVLLVSSAQNVSTVRNTHDVANGTFASAVGTGGIAVDGCQAMRDAVVYNGSNDVIITSGNYSITNYNITNAELVARFNVTVSSPLYLGEAWNVSYTCEPFGYDTSSGGRSLAGLIIVFFALAIAISVLNPVIREKMLTGIGK